MLEAMLAPNAMLGPLNCEAGFDERRGPLLLLLLPASSGAPDMPLAAAARAATLLTGVWLMLFLRVTRCAGLRLAADIECECGRFLGSEPTMVLDECRCWLAGRTFKGSCDRMDSQRNPRRAIAASVMCVGTLRTVMLAKGKKCRRPRVFALFSQLRQQGAAGLLHSLRGVGATGQMQGSAGRGCIQV